MAKYDVAPTLAAGLLRLARGKAGLTQAGLAERAGVTQQAISAYETGRKEPTLRTIQHLVEAAGFEIRMHLEPVDNHDRSLERLLSTLSPSARAEIEQGQRDRLDGARLERVRGR